MKSQSTVVVVEGLPETTAVLKAVLEPRGVAVSRCRRNRLPESQPIARPSVVVLHDEVSAMADVDSHWSNVPRIVIGTMNAPSTQTAGSPSYLSDPFHYDDLLSAIDSILETPAEPSTARAA